MPFLTTILIIVLALLIPTAYAAWIGAPYAPTTLAVVRKGLQELGIDESDVVVDLGAGDGGILLTAAAHGSRAIGFELSPIMWLIAKVRTWGKKNITLHFQNFYQQKFPQATVIFAFLMPANMARVRQLLRSQPLPQLKYVLAYAFPFPDIEPLHIIRESKCAPLYVYQAADVVSLP